ncbi:MAG: hypothetical protein WAL91_12225, partial [Propionicimonas sp.]
ADAAQRRNARRRLGRWRGSNHLDAGQVIRAIRDTETPPNRWLLRLAPDDPATLSRLVDVAGDLAVGLPVDEQPDELAQLDDVFLITTAGLVGRALVVGPPRDEGSEQLVLPLALRTVFAPVPVSLPRKAAAWVRGTGPNLRLLPPSDYRALSLI